jgi:hypothetical protein
MTSFILLKSDASGNIVNVAMVMAAFIQTIVDKNKSQNVIHHGNRRRFRIYLSATLLV